MPELVFKGKEYVYNHHLTVPYRPLVPDAAKSIGAPDLGGNLIIHGDNLHALKALLPRYAGKVDLIFIDPPYNTGNEGWCYNDNVNSPMMKEWLSSNPVGVEDMLRHDKWLCMMWPRITSLRELLAERGSIWMTIDDNETHRARMLFDELFGEDNFIGCFVWRKVDSPNDNKVSITPDHEFVLAYAKEKSLTQFSPMLAPGILDAYGQTDESGRLFRDRLLKKNGRNSLRKDRPTMFFPIKGPDGVDVLPIHDNGEEACWSLGRDGVAAHVAKGTLIWKQRKKGTASAWEPYTREYAPADPTRPYPTIWGDLPTMRQAKAMLSALFGIADVFSTPKPVELIERIVELANRPDAIVLDSFAGSGTTAHAVLRANSRDGGSRRFVLVEGEDYADRLTAERIRRAIGGYAWVGNQREVLHEEKVTWSQIKKADVLLAKVAAVQSAEGFSDDDKQMSLGESGKAKSAKRRFDKLSVKVEDGVLRVEGEKRISERVEGLGGSFTYCTLGDPLDMEKLLSGESMPTFDALGAWLFHTATGGALPKRPKSSPIFYLGEAADRHTWLIYRPDLPFLKSPDSALTLTRAKEIGEWGKARGDGKGHLVFAPAKYMSHKQLLEHGIEFAQLPFALYRES